MKSVKDYLDSAKRLITNGEKHYKPHNVKLLYNDQMIDLLEWWFEQTKKTDKQPRATSRLASYCVQLIASFSLVFKEHDLSIQQVSKLMRYLVKHADSILEELDDEDTEESIID